MRSYEHFVDHNPSTRDRSLCSFFSQREKHRSRQTEQTSKPLRLDPPSADICRDRSPVGPTYSGSLCSQPQCPAQMLQQPVLGPQNGGGGLLCHAKLGKRNELLQPSFLVNQQSVGKSEGEQIRGNDHRSEMARTPMVCKTEKDADRRPTTPKAGQKYCMEQRCMPRSPEEPKMGNIRLASFWKEKLKSQGWSEKSIQAFLSNWASSTWCTYEKQIEKLYLFCLEADTEFPYISSSTLADFLCYVSESSNRPKSILSTALAAVTSMCQALGIKDPVTEDVSKLVSGLIKGKTFTPMVRSSVLPVEEFVKLFCKWESNWSLTLENLRLKCLTLLALAMMLRPSDVAPHAKVIQNDGEIRPLQLKTDQVSFNSDGSCVITLHGIKNDYHRDGFDVVVKPTSNAKLDPVRCLKCYIERTKYFRPKHNPLFLSLKQPFDAISAKTVTRILEKAIILAGLKESGFSAKSFRPTGATVAVQAGVDPDVVRRVGRWKSRETFETHYVHSQPPKEMTDVVLKQL